MWLTSWLQKNQPRKQESRRARRRHVNRHCGLSIECLEDRVVPHADSLVGNITATIGGNLDSLGVKLLGPITAPADGSAFDAPVAGVLQLNHDSNGDGKTDNLDTQVPLARDTLSLTVDQNLDGTIPSTVWSSTLDGLADRYDHVMAIVPDPFFASIRTLQAEDALNAMDTNNDNVVSLRESYRVLVVGAVVDFLRDYDHSSGETADDLANDLGDFIQFTLDEPDILQDTEIFNDVEAGTQQLMDFDVVNFSQTNNAFDYSFEMQFTVNNQYLIDLGLQADENEVLFPEKVYSPTPGLVNAPATPRMVDLTGNFTFPLRFSVDDSSPPVDDNDFTFALTGPMTVAVNDSVSGDSGETLQGLRVNVGFLGTEVLGPAANSKFNLHMDWTLTITDPSSPIHLGFTQSLPTSSSSGALTAAKALPNDPGVPFVFPQDVFFDLTVGTQLTSPVRTVTVTAGSTADNTTATNLKDDVQTALNAQGLGSILTASLANVFVFPFGFDPNHLQMSLPNTDITPLGYADNEQFSGAGLLDAAGAPAGGAALGSTTSTTVTFLLSRGGGIPRLITVNTTPADDDPDGVPASGDEGELSMAGLIADINAGLAAAGFQSGFFNVTASDNAGRVRLNCFFSLETTRTLTLNAQNIITLAEQNHESFPEFIQGKQDTSDDKLQITMPLAVRDGVDFGPTGNPGIKVDVQPFDPAIGVLTPDSANVPRPTLPLTDLDGSTLTDPVNSDFVQYLDFNVLGAGEALGMINQLEGWLKQLRNTDLLGKFGIPFSQTVLGNLLAFEDLIHDTLITNDLDTDDTDDDIGKLLAKGLDPDQEDAFVATFGTAQELGARLKALGVLTLTDANNDGQNEMDENRDFAVYDKTNRLLTYQVGLSHLFASANLGADFTEELLGSLDPIAGITTQSGIHLQATGRVDAILGMEMGPGTISTSTLLADLNGGIGAGIGKGIAFTGALDARVIAGRLSAPASFDVSVVTGSGTTNARVTVPKTNASDTAANDPGTDDNTLLAHLIADINAALAGAANLDTPGTVNLADRLEVDAVLGQLVLRAKAGVQRLMLRISVTKRWAGTSPAAVHTSASSGLDFRHCARFRSTELQYPLRFSRA